MKRVILDVICLLFGLTIIIYDLYNINYDNLSFSINKQYYPTLFLMIIILPNSFKRLILFLKKDKTI